MAAALRQELAVVEQKNSAGAKSLAEIYGNAGVMFNYLQMPQDSLRYAIKELEQLERASAPAVRQPGSISRPDKGVSGIRAP